MATLDERVAYLEGRVEEHARNVDGIREALVSLEARMDRRFEAVDRRFESIDHRFESIEQRLTGVDGRIDGLDAKMSHQFVWLVGIQVTTLASVLGAFAATVAALVTR